MALKFAFWMPLPIALYLYLDSSILLAGTIFGLLYVFMQLITMTIQAGHNIFVIKQTSRDATFNATSDFLFAAISKPFEAIANVFKSIWSLFLGIAFWQSGEHVFASFMFLFSLLIIYYFALAVKESLLHSNTVLSKFKNNMIFTNLETLLLFILLTTYITLHL
ncbi:hypothetical protein E4L99_12465 [Lysinibacillus sp. S2017]|uniref:hypothetical protein n=2 Tax=unclassified Lysinibacillus TaxID=2636778 RepID=UPI001092E2FF|nr:hypothetical protein [Lysinibacillus sp. 2017]TGN34842.1 hypothetical protein E4L99_12465 [Lysinibacillus sp. S2017]